MFSFHVREGLELGLLEEHHAEDLYAAVDMNRDYLREWLPWVDVTQSPTDTQHFIRTTAVEFASRSSIVTGIWWDSSLVGTVGLHKIDWLNRRAEIGYWIVEQAQGKGIVSSCVQSMLRYAFHDLGMNRVEIRCAVGNGKSCAVPERLGFRLEGIMREGQCLNGKFVDQRIYAKLASGSTEHV
jgi:ribosomal-protein-serine acetyltransferase